MKKCKHDWRFLRNELIYDEVQDELHVIKLGGNKDVFYCTKCLKRKDI